MKRYPIPSLLMISVLALGLVVGCDQRQKHEDILDYLDKTAPLRGECLDAICAVTESYVISEDALAEAREHPDADHLQEFLKVVANEKEVADEALHTVNSALSFLEKTSPPHEAESLHDLTTRALQAEREGLVKLSAYSRIRYEYLYSVLDPSVQKQEYPPAASEDLAQGLHLIGEASRMWCEAIAETDHLLQLIK